MLMIVSGHAGVKIVVYTAPVHVGLFFMCSGFLLKKTSVKESLINNIRKLYLPFVAFSLVFICFHNVLVREGWLYTNMQHWYLVTEHALLMDVTEPLLAPMWFVTALFIASTIWTFADLINEYLDPELTMKPVCIRTILLSIVAMIGLNFTMTSNTILSCSLSQPQILNVSMVASFMLELGYLLRKAYDKYGEKLESCKLRYAMCGVLAWGGTLLILNTRIGKELVYTANMRENQYCDFYLYVVLAVLTFVYLFILASFLKRRSVFIMVIQAVSKHSFWIMAIHMLVLDICETRFGIGHAGIRGYFVVFLGMSVPIILHISFQNIHKWKRRINVEI